MSLEDCREGSPPASCKSVSSFARLVAAQSNLCPLSYISPFLFHVFFLLIKTPVVLDLGLTLLQYDLILTKYKGKDYFQIKSHSEVLVDMNFGDSVEAGTDA